MPAFETSSSVTFCMISRARGPARFTAAYWPVTSVTATRRGVPASHQRSHCSTASRLPVVVETKNRSAAEPGDRAVVEQDAGVVEHRAVADAPDAQVAEAVRVQPVEERAGVRRPGRRACPSVLTSIRPAASCTALTSAATSP